jgi:hypothetical protein
MKWFDSLRAIAMFSRAWGLEKPEAFLLSITISSFWSANSDYLPN